MVLKVGCLILGCVAVCACSDKNALISFNDSGCKKSIATTALTSSYSPADSAEFDGLECISYGMTSDNSIAAQLFNFVGACGARWKGVATVDDPHSLAVGVTNPGCQIGSCGACIYDWAFEIDGVKTGADVALTITEEYCPGDQPRTVETASLPAATLEQGLLCRYADWGTLMQWLHIVGTLNTPCGETGYGEEIIACDGDLICAPVGEGGHNICVKPCSIAADCPLPDVTMCQDNLCVLDPAAAW